MNPVFPRGKKITVDTGGKTFYSLHLSKSQQDFGTTFCGKLLVMDQLAGGGLFSVAHG
jgi:hypothetical protein